MPLYHWHCNFISTNTKSEAPKGPNLIESLRKLSNFRIPLKSQPMKAESSAIKLASLFWHCQRVMLLPVAGKVAGKMFLGHNFLQGVPPSVVKGRDSDISPHPDPSSGQNRVYLNRSWGDVSLFRALPAFLVSHLNPPCLLLSQYLLLSTMDILLFIYDSLRSYLQCMWNLLFSFLSFSIIRLKPVNFFQSFQIKLDFLVIWWSLLFCW